MIRWLPLLAAAARASPWSLASLERRSSARSSRLRWRAALGSLPLSARFSAPAASMGKSL